MRKMDEDEGIVHHFAASRGPATQWFKISFDKKGLLAFNTERTTFLGMHLMGL